MYVNIIIYSNKILLFVWSTFKKIKEETQVFFAFSHTMGNWWENPCIFHMMKYTIGWKSYEKKVTILWEKYEYQFPRISVAFSRIMGNRWQNPCISHMMKYTIGWVLNGEKSTHTMGKLWLPISQVLPIRWALLLFSMLWQIDGKSQAFPKWWDLSISFCVRPCRVLSFDLCHGLWRYGLNGFKSTVDWHFFSMGCF